MTSVKKLWKEINPTAEVELVSMLLEQMSDGGDARSNPAAALLYGLTEQLEQAQDARALEAIAEAFWVWLRNSRQPDKDFGFVVARLREKCLNAALKLTAQNRQSFVGLKLASAAAFVLEYRRSAEGIQDGDADKQIKDCGDLAVNCALKHVLGAPPDDQKDRIQWLAKKLPRLVEFTTLAFEKDPYVSKGLCEWMRERTSDWMFLAQAKGDHSLLQERIGQIELNCHISLSELAQRLGWLHTAFADLEKAVYCAALEVGLIDDARLLASKAIAAGDEYVQSGLTGENDLEQLRVRERIANLSRLSGDVRQIVRRLDDVCSNVKNRAAEKEADGLWLEAADAYSNLGYRYFSTAEYAQVERLYILSIYYFQKSKFFRAKEPALEFSSEDSSDPNAPEPGYRRFEADGFILGASAKMARGKRVITLLRDAAYAHSKAAQMAFGQMGLHSFYNSAAHYFDAHAELRLALEARTSRRLVWRLRNAATAIHKCFPMMRSVFGYYEDMLVHLCDRAETPFEQSLESDMARTNHPNAEVALGAAEAIRQGLAGGDGTHVHEHIQELASSMIFINPLG